jgi:hypothetical protein
VRKARESVASEEMTGSGMATTAGVSVPSSGFIDKKILRDWLVSQGFGRTTGDFTNKGHATSNHTLNAMDMGILGGSDANALRKTIDMERKLKSTGAFGSQLFGPERDPYGHGAGKGGQNIHLHIPTPGGKVPMTPGLSSLMKTGDIGAGSPGKILGSERRQTLATQQTGFALNDQRVVNLRAEKRAAEESAIAIANYVAAIAPVAEQELQNQLLNKRIELMRNGVTGDYLETEIKIFEIREKQAFGIAAANQAIERNNKAVSDGLMSKEDANRLNAIQNKTIQDLIANIPKLITLTEQQAIAQEDLNFQTAKSDLNKQMKMAMALTPDAELRVQLAEKYPGDTMRQEEEFAQTKMVEKASKLKQDLQGIAASIGDSFGNAFKGIITGSMTAQQALAGFFQGIGDSFADMAAKMISEWLKVEAVKGIQSILGMLNPAGALGGASTMGGSSYFNPLTGLGTAGPNFQMANGGILPGKFTAIPAFATGGIVKGPTLGLVGEGRYNEAVVPLPDGKSIPVDLSGMGGGAGAISTNIVINVSNGQAQSNSSGGASDLGRKMEGAVKQVLANELRPGGLLSGGRR